MFKLKISEKRSKNKLFYLQFQKKIEKRGRKLIDFDKERHNVQQLSSNPNRNEAKFAR